MPDKVVTLEFEGKGIVELTRDVKDLANAVGSLPPHVAFGGRSKATGAGTPPAIPAAASSAHSAFLAQQQTFGASGPSKAQQQSNRSAQNIKINVAALAQATAQGNMSLTSLASTIAKLHPAAGLAVGSLTAVAAAMAAFTERGLNAGKTNFLYGPTGGSSVRGMSASLGGDQAAVAERMQSAIDSDQRARMYATNAGVMPSGDVYGGDPDLPRKLKRIYEYYGDPKKVDQRTASDAVRHLGLDPETVSKLRALDDANRSAALNTQDNVPESSVRRAAQMQSGWDKLVGGVKALGGGILDRIFGAQEAWVNGGPKGKPGYSTFGGPWNMPADDKSADKLDTAADKMVKAAEKMGHAVDKFGVGGEGVGGGGQRSRHAFPPGWGHIQFQEAQLKTAAPMGVIK